MGKIDNTVIKVLDKEHGKKVLEWWRTQGVDTSGYTGECNLLGGYTFIYYGLINGCFANYSEEFVKLYDVKIIELLQEKDYSIKGTPLPTIPNGTVYRCQHWEDSDPNSTLFGDFYNMVSYGIVEYKGIKYVMYEKKDYEYKYHYMTPLSIIQKLDKKDQQKPEPEPMKTRTIKPKQGQQIIDAACSGWKDTLFDKWGKQIVLKQEITIEEGFYQEMRKACTKPQYKLFDEIFGKDFQNPYKVGDFLVVVHGGWNCCTHVAYRKSLYEGNIDEIVGFDFFENQLMALTKTGAVLRIEMEPTAFRIATEEEVNKVKYIPKGTPCLVRDFTDESWRLVYSNGDGSFDGTFRGKIPNRWKHVQILDIQNLPTE